MPASYDQCHVGLPHSEPASLRDYPIHVKDTMSQHVGHGECDIDAARAGKTSGTQQLTGRVYDNRAGSDVDGSEHTPHQAHTGGIRRGRSSRTSPRQSRSQTCQRYTERIGDRCNTSGAQPIRRSQPYAPERVAEGAGGHRHRS